MGSNCASLSFGWRPGLGKKLVGCCSRHSFAIAPNLLNRNFKIMVPDTVWLADISYIPTDEGCFYLAAVKDLATMEIVGWSMSERLKSILCEDALKMAIRNRRPTRGLIVHSGCFGRIAISHAVGAFPEWITIRRRWESPTCRRVRNRKVLMDNGTKPCDF